MEAKIGKNFARLIEDLEQSGPEYSVFYAVFLAEKISRRLFPHRDDTKLEQDGLRFRPYEYYVFPPKDIRALEFKDNTFSFILNFMGLYGINSPLPRCYHELVALQQNVHGPGKVPLQNFLDIFNTRSYWLYYQAWKKYRYFLQFGFGRQDKVVRRVFSFMGRMEGDEEFSSRINEFKLYRLSGILSHRLRNKQGLSILLQEFFPQTGFSVQEFIPHRVKLAERPSLGTNGDGDGFRLSEFSTVGESVVDLMGRICVEVGPLEFEEYLEFTPGSENARLLQELLDLYLNDGLEYDIRFILNAESIGKVAWNDRRLKLGVSLWMGKPQTEAVDVYYTYERFCDVRHTSV